MEFKLPELGEGVHEGELVKWCVKVGDQVKYDQPLCEVMTDKATIEVPSPFQGKVSQVHVPEGQTVKVGQLMVSFEGASGTATPSASHATAAPVMAAAAPAATVGAKVAVGDSNPATRVLAAPVTRRLAREMGVDLATIDGSGPHGRVTREDVQNHAQGGAPVAKRSKPMTAPVSAREARTVVFGGEERVPLKGLRKKIAEKMRQSKDHAAHFTYVEEADATELVKLRQAAKEMGAKAGVKVTYLPFLMKAMVAALKQYPILNSSLDEERGELVYKHYFNIALSVQTEDGLSAPVIKNVDQKTILELARDIEEVVGRVRNKKATLDDFQGGTITLTNAGSIGGLFATPVINYPEVAILGFNKIFRKPVVKEINGREEIVIRDWTYFSISLDHRVVDGAIGAEFMKLFISHIENPALLLLETL